MKTKYISCILLCLLLVLQLPSAAGAQADGDAPQTAADGTYLVGTADELYWVADYVNHVADVGTAVRIKLTADIHLNPGVSFRYDHETGRIAAAKDGKTMYIGTGLQGTALGAIDAAEDAPKLRRWVPIGTAERPFKGDFDGNNHTIDGLYINDPTLSQVGLIGYMTESDGTLNNNRIIRVTIGQNSLAMGYQNGAQTAVGAVAGYVCGVGLVRSCVNDGIVLGQGSVVPKTEDGVWKGAVGGVVGVAYKIAFCQNNGTVISPESAGGIVGSIISDGQNTAPSTMLCINRGAVYTNAAAPSRAGGIAAYAAGDKQNTIFVSIRRCMNYGRVEGDSAAGILQSGGDMARVTQSGNFGTIAAASVAAGLVGTICGDNFDLQNSYNAAQLTGADTAPPTAARQAYPLIGGMTAALQGTAVTYSVQTCYNDSDVYPTADGAPLGAADLTLTDCFSVPTAVFASGEVACRIGMGQSLPLPFEPDKVIDTYPGRLGAPSVFKIQVYCCHRDSAVQAEHRIETAYANQSRNISRMHEDDGNGRCVHCGVCIKAPTLLTETPEPLHLGQKGAVQIYADATTDAVDFTVVTSETDNTPYTMPAGLSVNRKRETGCLEIIGLPRVSGRFTFTVQTKTAYGSDQKTYTLNIESTELRIMSGEKLFNATAGKSYGYMLRTNFDAAAEWSLAEGSVLPGGLTLDSAGMLSGTPQTAGKYSFTVMAASLGKTAFQTLRITVLEEGGCKHREMVKHPGTPPTCRSTGRADLYHCNTCEENYYDAGGKQWIPKSYVDSVLETKSNHEDTDCDNRCDFCSEPMPIFKKVLSQNEVTVGGFYVFAAEIDGQLYALAQPEANAETTPVYRSYGSCIPSAVVTESGDGSLAWNTLAAQNALMLRLEYPVYSDFTVHAAQYGISAIIDRFEYNVTNEYGNFTLMLQDDWRLPQAIAVDETDASRAVRYICADTARQNHELCAYVMTYNGTTSVIFSVAEESDYNGEGKPYAGAQMTRYPVYLYKMTDCGTVGSATYTMADVRSVADVSAFDALFAPYAAAELSETGGYAEAVDRSYADELVSLCGAAAARVETYAQLTAVDCVMKTNGSGAAALTYVITPCIRVCDTSGRELVHRVMPEGVLSDRPIWGMFHTGGIKPQLIIGQKRDGTQEVFYPMLSLTAPADSKRFTYDADARGEGLAGLYVTDFSQIWILAENVTAELRQEGESVTVCCAEPGTYAVVFAAYENGKIKDVTLTEQTFTLGNQDLFVPDDIVLQKGDRIYLWESRKTMRPLCGGLEMR